MYTKKKLLILNLTYMYNKNCIILNNRIYFLLLKILKFYSLIISDAIKLVNSMYVAYCYPYGNTK